MGHEGDKDRQRQVAVDGYDLIEVASIDSFPASDPPGWIETKARPCSGDAASVEEWPRETAKSTKRAASR
jgi:hypothetical protein